jgi:hypothetical protein
MVPVMVPVSNELTLCAGAAIEMSRLAQARTNSARRLAMMDRRLSDRSSGVFNREKCDIVAASQGKRSFY